MTNSLRLSPRYGWLAAAIPADARRFRVDDAALAAALSAARAELVDARPDVEIASAAAIRGDARCAVVPVHAAEPSATIRAARGAQRLARTVALQTQAERGRRALRSRGYTHTELLRWERGVPVAGAGARAATLRLAHRFPLNAAVVGRRESETTVLDAALAAASAALGRPLRIEWFMFAASGVTMAIGESAIIRIGIGPAAAQIADAQAALEVLVRRRPPRIVLDRLPLIEASGSAGIAFWTAERRLRGRKPRERPGEALTAECVRFLAALHDADRTGRRQSLAATAEPIARIVDGPRAGQLCQLARRLDERLAGIPRGFAHGDFWSGNLLLADGRLSGVVDWSFGGPGMLPLLDLLHLQANDIREATGRETGSVVVHELLSRAAAGGDDAVRAYGDAIHLELRPDVLADLVAAYWIHALAHELLDPDRELQGRALERWRAMNVDGVLERLRTAL